MPDWNEAYNKKIIGDSVAAGVLLNNIRLLPAGGKALDYACGLAANSLLLAEKGFVTEAWDASSVAVKKINTYAEENNLQIRAIEMDLENNPPAIENYFDVIVVSYFLYRENLPDLYKYLKPGGILFYQTYSGQQINNHGPSRSAFRLQRGELLKVFSDMQLLFYREDSFQIQNEDSQPDIVQFVAMK